MKPTPTTPTDAVLLERYLRQDDADAFAQLVRRYTDLVYHTCRRVLGDGQRAEDAAQETFYRLMRRPDAVKHSLPAWLHRAATNLCIDALRSESARQSRERSYQRLADQRRRLPDTWAELAGSVDAALDRLEAPQRTLLIEHFYAGRTQQELARRHGVSKATMSRRVNAALQALRDRLEAAAGLAVTAAALSATLASAQASATPVTLSSALSRMAMVSGTHAGSTAGSAGSVLLVAGTVTLGAAGVLGLILTVVLSYATFQRHATADAAPATADSEITHADPPHPLPQDTGLIIVQPVGDRLSSERIVSFHLQHGVVAVGYADGHVVSLPLERARPLIEAQAGDSLETLVQRGVR